MKIRNLVVLAATLAMVMGLSVTARAETEKSAALSTSIMSNYVWRGLTLSDDAVIQPSMDFGYGPFSANFWANFDTDTEETNEVDFTLNYSIPVPVENVGLDVGYIYYALDGVDDTQEFYLSAAYDFVVSPSLTAYWDIDEGTGWYIVAGLGYSHDIAEKASFSVGGSVSYLVDNGVVGVDKSGTEYTDFHNADLSASVAIQVTEDLSIEPMVAYSFPLSDDSEDGISQFSVDGEEEVFYGGVTASLSF